MKKISVITPCYNSYDYLDKCFDSLVNQTIGIENIEIIFVNDASTDNTGEKLNSYEALYPESILVIHLDENVKQGGARNVALQYVSGEYIIFVDSDDWVDLSYFETVYNIAKENNNEVVVLGALGCGAFCNPPEIVAKAMKTVVEEYIKYFQE